jgi:uncharacterized protein (TIGR02996 family)
MLRTFASKDRVWSIDRRGKSLVIRHGKAAGKQQERRRGFPNDALAERELRKLVRSKLNDGYRETTPPGSMPPLAATGRALEQAVVDDPADQAAHMAFADWLSEQPEVKLQTWGEFIRTQLALEAADLPATQRKSLTKHSRELIDTNQRDWLGEPLAQLLLELNLNMLPPVLRKDEGVFDYRFKRGWLDLLVIPYLNARVAEVLAGSASLRLLRELVILDTPDRGDPYAPLVATPNLVNVRILTFEGVNGRASPAPLLGNLPRLEELDLVLASFDPSGLLALPNLANLRTLSISVLDNYSLEGLASSPHLGQLRRLLLNSLEDTGDDLDYEWNPLALDEVGRALRSPHLKNLTELRVHQFASGDEGCVEIASSGVLKRLEILDLSHGTLTDDGARALASCPDLPRLKKLIVTGNALTPAGVRLLRATGVPVESRRQHRLDIFFA